MKLLLCLSVLYTLCTLVVAEVNKTSLSITAVSGGQQKVVKVDCNAGTGDHPYLEEVCKALLNIAPELAVTPIDDCASVGAETTVTTTGFVNGASVNLKETFPNFCAAEHRFGILVKGVLPRFFE